MALAVRNPPANAVDLRDLGSILDQEEPSKRALYSSILPWENPMDTEPGGLRSTGVSKSRTTTRRLSAHAHKVLKLQFVSESPGGFVMHRFL